MRGAAHQPVDWYPWSEEAFERARRENKPILLDIGAVWCHWCHVIDQESYDDPEVAKIINDHFVPIKVDRDVRPDVDARYQQAVGALTGQGGWPLTAFLTPEGKVFYGGTYFPPQDAHGRPSFKRVLLSVAAYYRESNDEAVQAAEQVHRQLAMAGPSAGARVDVSTLHVGVESIRRLYDAAHGGFGTAPKFPHPATLEFLLRRYGRTRDDTLLEMVARTLEKMGRGGIHDQVGGGFHRYATDARWIVPHFEKMLYDNTALLMNYVHAHQATGNPYFKQVAEDTAAFMGTVLYDQARGGFYGSQDADVGPGDDGSYFTWSIEEAKAALSADEFAVLAERFHLQGHGEMHADPTRHVLFADKDPDVIAAITGRAIDDVLRLIERGTRKLAEARMPRKTPYVDTAIYVNWNGMAISAFLEVFKGLGEERYRGLAVRALDRILDEGYEDERGCAHVLGSTGPRLLDDQVQMAQALLDACEVTGTPHYLRTAREIMNVVLRDYQDETGGFFDVPRDSRGPALETPHKPIQDAPTPAPNAVAALVLLRLSRMFNDRKYRQAAERVVNAFAPSLAHHGLFASTLLLAADDLLHEPAHVTVVGSAGDPRSTALHQTALSTYRPDKIISHIRDGTEGDPIPDAVRAMLTQSPEPAAYVCAGTACALPTSDPQQLAETIRTFGRS
ncbi:MAG: thioredoxin domain-containing protein [Armatimonadetes bacterium]|nr:thioredoxin domain-containing protein [Armatimonadota bacterium]